MADSQTTVLRLVFGTEVPSKTYALEVNSPNAELTDTVIRPVMQHFTASPLVRGVHRLLTSIENAEIVTRQVTDLLP